ncbi:MAG: type II toxin-antitoxin system VapC family toxin [Planctomycetota bacterium]
MLLLDTCAVLWLAGDQDTLSDAAKQAIAASAGSLFVSAITAFEMAHKHRQGKLTLPIVPDQWYPEALNTHGLAELPITGAISLGAVALPRIHRDPCDRLIVATALAEDLPIVTADETIPQYPGVHVIW